MRKPIPDSVLAEPDVQEEVFTYEDESWGEEAARRRIPRRFSRRRVSHRPYTRRHAPVRRRRYTPVVRLKRRPLRRRPVTVRRRRRPRYVIRRYVDLPVTRYRTVLSPKGRPCPVAILTHFLMDGIRIQWRHQKQIRQIARHIVTSWDRDQPIRLIRLVGHTNNRGSARSNRLLGEQRAMAVRNRLIREINRMRPKLMRNIEILARSAGGTRPLACNRTIPGRAFNHRVEIYFPNV